MKQKIYEEQIRPLIETILNICEKYDIPMFNTCQLNEDRTDDADPSAFISSALLPRDGALPLHLCKEIMVGDLGKELANALGLLEEKKEDSLNEFLPVPKASNSN